MKATTETSGILLYRWHISRIYEFDRFRDAAGNTDAAEREAHVTVTPSTTVLLDQLHLGESEGPDLGASMRQLRFSETEDLDWWDPVEDHEIEGWALESTFLRALQAGRFDTDQPLDPTPRALVEDMVLVQALPYPGLPLDDVRGETDLPDLNAWVDVENALWVDATRPARRLSATLYRRALREQRQAPRQGGDDAGKR